MQRKRTFFVVAAMACALLCAPAAWAMQTVTYSFEGELDSFFNFGGGSASPPATPIDFAMMVSLPLDTPGVSDFGVLDPTIYTPTMFDFLLTFDSPDLPTIDSASGLEVIVRNSDPPDLPEDQFSIFADIIVPTDTVFPGAGGDGTGQMNLFMGTTGGPNTVFSDELLPTSLDLADFPNTTAINFRVAFGSVIGSTGGSWEYRGELTDASATVTGQAIPEPTTPVLALLGVTGVMAALYRRRKAGA